MQNIRTKNVDRIKEKHTFCYSITCSKFVNLLSYLNPEYRGLLITLSNVDGDGAFLRK